jgi:hypothetical protein
VIEVTSREFISVLMNLFCCLKAEIKSCLRDENAEMMGLFQANI